jgi:2-keto-4-pentenoate hydratase
MTDVAAAADALIEARRSGEDIDTLPGGAMPASIEEAYAIQDSMIERIGDALVGWKVAFTNETAQQRMGASEPAAGPIFKAWCYESPATVAMPDPGLRITECEFGIRLGADLTGKDGGYTSADVAQVVASVHPSIEIANLRFASKLEAGVLGLIADCGGNGGFIYSAGTEDWQGIDFANHRVRHLIDGEEAAVGNGQSVMGGDPLASVAWLANNLATRGRGLKAGEFVSSGLTTQMLPVAVGGSAAGDFGDLGTVEVRFTG